MSTYLLCLAAYFTGALIWHLGFRRLELWVMVGPENEARKMLAQEIARWVVAYWQALKSRETQEKKDVEL